jgi:hypothetical protein
MYVDGEMDLLHYSTSAFTTFTKLGHCILLFHRFDVKDALNVHHLRDGPWLRKSSSAARSETQ